MLIVLFLGYAWCRWGAGEWGFSPLIEMGKCSLLVYWVHLEFVYGGLSILPKRAVGIREATIGLLVIFVAMTLLAFARNRFPNGSRRCWRCSAGLLESRSVAQTSVCGVLVVRRDVQSRRAQRMRTLLKPGSSSRKPTD